MESIDFILLITSLIIFLGYAGDIFFKKTKIPSFLFLILTGFLLGPVFGILSKSALMPVIGILAQITLIMVIFHGGIDLRLGSIFRDGWRAFLQVLLYIGISFVIITFLTYFVLHFPLLITLIFSSIVSGETTAAIIIPLAREINVKQATVTFLTFESALNSIVLVILFITFTGLYFNGNVNAYSAAYSLISSFSIGIFIGFVLSVLWIYLINYLKNRNYTYVLILGLLFLTYALSDVAGGSGYLAVIVFGIVFGNYKFISSFFQRKIEINKLKKEVFKFHGEITFLLRSFFFVFVGLVLSISLSNIYFGLLIGSAITLILLASRFIAVSISTYNSSMVKDKNKILISIAQGVTPITLAVLAFEEGIPKANTILTLVAYIVILTNVITTIGVFLTMRHEEIKTHKV